MKYKILYAEMKKHKDNMDVIGAVLGISRQAVSSKLKGKTDWTISEVDTLCKRYDMNYYELFKGV